MNQQTANRDKALLEALHMHEDGLKMSSERDWINRQVLKTFNSLVIEDDWLKQVRDLIEANTMGLIRNKMLKPVEYAEGLRVVENEHLCPECNVAMRYEHIPDLGNTWKHWKCPECGISSPMDKVS